MKMSRKKTNQLIPSICLRLTLTITISLVLYVIFADWSYIWAFYELKNKNYETVECSCVAISQARNNEIYGHHGGRSRYDFFLENGETVAAYRDTIDQTLSISGVEGLRFLVGQELTFTYIPKGVFSNGAYVLVSIRNHDQVIVSEKAILDSYVNRLSRIIPVAIALGVPALLASVIPLGIHLFQLQKKKKRKKRRNARSGGQLMRK